MQSLRAQCTHGWRFLISNYCITMLLFSPFPRDNETPTYFFGLGLMQACICNRGVDRFLSRAFASAPFSRRTRAILLFLTLYNGVDPSWFCVVSPAPCSRRTRANGVIYESTPFRPWLSHVQLPRTMPNVMVSLRARFGLWYLCRIRLGPDHGVHKQVCVKIARGVDEVMRSSHDA